MLLLSLSTNPNITVFVDLTVKATKKVKRTVPTGKKVKRVPNSWKADKPNSFVCFVIPM